MPSFSICRTDQYLPHTPVTHPDDIQATCSVLESSAVDTVDTCFNSSVHPLVKRLDTGRCKVSYNAVKQSGTESTVSLVFTFRSSHNVQGHTVVEGVESTGCTGRRFRGIDRNVREGSVVNGKDVITYIRQCAWQRDALQAAAGSEGGILQPSDALRKGDPA